MGRGGQIHDLLNAGLAKNGSAGLPAGVDIGMISEDRKGVSGDGSGSHVDDAGQQFSGHAVEIGQHEEQSLRGREGDGQRACQQRSVNRGCRPGLRLQLGDYKRAAEDVFQTVFRPFVTELGHGGGRGDGIDGGGFAVGVGYVGSRLTAVHSLGRAGILQGGLRVCCLSGFGIRKIHKDLLKWKFEKSSFQT